MSLIVRTHSGRQYLAAAPGQPLIGRIEDVNRVLEECFSHEVQRLLLYPEHLTPHFFDISSGEAGEILNKLRQYRIRLAIVVPPGTPMSRRFAELMADEQQGEDVRLFADQQAAEEWLCGGG
jgi:hypothetical protein